MHLLSRRENGSRRNARGGPGKGNREELDTEITIDKFLHTVDYDYPQFHFTLHCFMCSLKSQQMHLNEHEAARWLNAEDLQSVQWLPADEELLPLIVQELTNCN